MNEGLFSHYPYDEDGKNGSFLTRLDLDVPQHCDWQNYYDDIGQYVDNPVGQVKCLLH